MNWTYALERMPSDDHENRHVVRVTSKPRKSGANSADANAANAAGERSTSDSLQMWTNTRSR